MNYLPFDLETALKHPERVVTRDGRKVTEIYHFKTSLESEQSLFATIDRKVKSFWVTGEWGLTKYEHSNNLFLLPEVKKVWVNVYETSRGIYIGPNHPTKEKAIDCINDDRGKYIKTILITNEPE